MVSTTKCSSSTFSFSSGGASTCIDSTAPCNSGMFSYPDPSLADLDLDFYYFTQKQMAEGQVRNCQCHAVNDSLTPQMEMPIIS